MFINNKVRITGSRMQTGRQNKIQIIFKNEAKRKFLTSLETCEWRLKTKVHLWCQMSTDNGFLSINYWWLIPFQSTVRIKHRSIAVLTHTHTHTHIAPWTTWGSVLTQDTIYNKSQRLGWGKQTLYITILNVITQQWEWQDMHESIVHNNWGEDGKAKISR